MSDGRNIDDTKEILNEQLEISDNKYQFLGSLAEQIVFLSLMVFICSAPIIFSNGIPSHADWHIHMERAYNFKRCFWQGQWMPRWIDTQASGYGLAVFNYYAPLVYYVFVLFELFARNPIISIKLIFIIPILLSTFFGYLYFNRHGSSVATSIALVFLVSSPAIHMYVYNENWPGSVWAIPFVFLTLYGIDIFDKQKDSNLKSLLITAAGYCGLVLTHIASAFMFSLLMIPYFFLTLFIYRTKKYVKNFVLSFLLGGALAAFYLIPASLETKYVHANEVLTKGPLWDYSKNFLYTYLDRDKSEGYAWAIFDHRYYEVSNALFGLAVLVCIFALLFNKEKIQRYFNEPFRVNVAIIMFAISFLMMTPVSLFVWLMIKPLQTVQFPWRFTTFIVPFGGLIIVYAFDLIFRTIKEKITFSGARFVTYSLMLLFSLLAFVDFINVYHWKWIPEHTLLKSASSVLWANEEYRPALNNDPYWKQVDYSRDFSPSIASTDESSNIKLIKWFSHERVFQVFSANAHTVRLRTFYFPGWTVYIDGKEAQINMDQRLGAMLILVPPGQHEIKVKFEHTPLRKETKYISLAALAVYAFLLLNFIQGKKNKSIKKEPESSKEETDLPLEVLAS